MTQTPPLDSPEASLAALQARHDALLGLIRRARTIEEVRKAVGPSPAQLTERAERLAEMERLWASFGNAVPGTHKEAREKYRRLKADEEVFERTYLT